MPDQSETTADAPLKPDLLPAWIAACLGDGFQPPAGAFPLDAAAAEGILPWLAYRLYDSGALDSLPAEQRDELRDALRRWSLMHLDCEGELERLMESASQAGLHFLAFKGHSVSRTLYPNPACRPTSDFDLLINPRQLEPAKAWLSALGYEPVDPFAGTLWLGAQSWSRTIDGTVRFHVDVHWDYTSRMYFRRRLGFEEIWDASLEVPCGETSLRVPCKVDNLLIACVHLAAFDPGIPVRLIWLLDIYLLMAALDEAELAFLLERAEKAHAIEACLVFGEMAAELGPEGSIEPVLDALRGLASERQARAYYRTLRWRALDLGAYWVRLPVKEKLEFFGDLVRWIRVRD